MITQWYKKYLVATICFGFSFAVIILSISIGLFFSKTEAMENSKKFLITKDDPFAGSPDAKIHIVEFSDFQCPFCKKAQPTIAEIIKKYGDKIHFVYRDFPLKNHPYSQKAAEAGECAQDQGKFWQLHDEIFDDQSNITIDDLKRKALKIQMPDMIKFNECLDSGKYEREVKNDLSAGEKAGVKGTPTFFINGQIMNGSIQKNQFIEMIDQYLD